MKNKDEKNGLEIKETISLKAVLFFLGFIFTLLVLFVFYLRFSNFSPLYGFYHKETISMPTSLDLAISARTQNLAVDKEVELKVTENQVKEAAKIDSKDFPLKKADLKLNQDGILIAGKTADNFLGVPVEVTIVPVVKNEKIDFEIREIKAAGVVAPPAIKDPLTGKLNTLFANLLPLEQNIAVKEVHLFSGYALITAIKK